MQEKAERAIVVTTNGTRKSTKRKTKSKSIVKRYLPKTKPGWILLAGVAAVSLFGVVNAGLNYGSYHSNYQHRQLDIVIFADVKPTPLTTKITNTTNDGNLTTISFLAENVNATLKLEKFECLIDGTQWKECISPVVIDSTKHDIIEIRAVDNQGGVESQPAVQLFN